MAEACGASDVKSHAGEALGLGLRVDGDAAWAPLVLAMAEMERLVFHRVHKGAHSGSSSDARPLGFQLWNLRGFTTYRVFSQLGVAVRNENEKKIKGLNRNLNDGWYFHKLARIRKLVHKLPHSAT